MGLLAVGTGLAVTASACAVYGAPGDPLPDMDAGVDSGTDGGADGN